MGAAQAKDENDFVTPELAASFYEGVDNVGADLANPGFASSRTERSWVRKMATEYVQDHPDLTQKQRDEILAGRQDRFFWPMARCLQFCKIDASVTKDGKLRFEKGDMRGPDQRFMKCLDHACATVQAHMNASLEKQYGRGFIQ